ncbi:hypothetical protein KRR38_28270 [Novosphingobium sp. G106]|uniref:hypothetical protein n=1 Tax=Novosphingobium sp. G106 TaxID=2849500 RepID=UPI001C2DE680|nr:hypothetical protein [Novosphingobium sp. G106]MBV1691474.1 hypothetical protein [Novosphingobium sp. G106]
MAHLGHLTLRVSGLSILATIAGAAISAQAAAPVFPPAVMADLRDMASQCREVTNKPGKPGTAVRRVDINADGRTDFLVFQGEYDCEDAVSLLAPGASYGVVTKLYLGQANGGVTKAWEDSTWGPQVVRIGTATAYTFDLMGSICGDRRGSRVAVADRLSCTLQLRPDARGKWGLQPLVRGHPIAISATGQGK